MFSFSIFFVVPCVRPWVVTGAVGPLSSKFPLAWRCIYCLKPRDGHGHESKRIQRKFLIIRWSLVIRFHYAKITNFSYLNSILIFFQLNQSNTVWLCHLSCFNGKVFMENVADTSQSRVKMVNSTIECDASTYSEVQKFLNDGNDLPSCSKMWHGLTCTHCTDGFAITLNEKE